MQSLLARPRRLFAGRRDAWPWFDHLVRAWVRYRADGGDRLAAALTMYAVFALLPLLLVGVSLLGYVIANNPEQQAKVFTSVTRVLPGAGSQLADVLTSVKANRAATGIFGLVGLAFSGLGGVDALRDALRLMWHQSTQTPSLLRKKLNDLLVVGLVGAALLVSFAISALATGGAGALLDRSGVGGTASHLVVNVLSFGVGVAVDAGLFLILFKWLPKVDWPLRRLVRGAVLGGFLFGIVQLAGGWYVGRTATRSTALYGSIGTAIAILVGMYLVCRVVLYTAAWTVTSPGWDDVEPSGTASERAAAVAGVRAGPAVPASDPFGGAPREDATPPRGDRAPLPVGAAATRAAYRGPSERAQAVAVLSARAMQGFAATFVAAVGWRGVRALRRG